MSFEAISDLIKLNNEIAVGLEEERYSYTNYSKSIKPLIEEFRLKHGENPGLFIQNKYLKSFKTDLDIPPFRIASFGHHGNNAIREYVWACIHCKYPNVKQFYASYSPQLYVLVHRNGIKFGLDYGSQISNDDSFVKEVLNKTSMQEQIVHVNQFVNAYELKEGTPELAMQDGIDFSRTDDVIKNWNNKIHLINQFKVDEIPEDIDTKIKDALWILFPLFESLCGIKLSTYNEYSEPQMAEEPEREYEDDLDFRGDDYSIDDFLAEVFVSEDEVENMLNQLERKKNIILQGPPGTGKTFIAKRLAMLHQGNTSKERIEIVQFHQSYAYDDFIQGYRPSEEGFELRNGVFYDFVMQASSDPNNQYYFIIDEINRGNLSKIFGELLMLIEADKRGERIKLIYNKEPFRIPTNVFLIGTMNTADRSLAVVDYALRRRFAFIDVNPSFDERLEKFMALKGVSEKFARRITSKLNDLNTQIENDPTLGKGYCIGHSYFCSEMNDSEENWFLDIIRYEIEPLLNEYWFDDLKKSESLINVLASL